MQDLENIQKRLKAIEKRNQRVETDKSWETSLTRRFLVAIVTYLVVVLFFVTMSLAKPFINAIVPTMGFLLSTLSVNAVKKYWVKKHNKLKSKLFI